ncbi:phospholipase [Marinobacter halodurans]|uniref:Phospholipase A1 n=1 Tax=Marinobacter halodurans TaxID=2528979 RepID=A0ABY1ZNS0_9GAMM|nr:phospholipase A [Marinobacter halodurans]TBW58182.1 phospholipase [Marinobacter halodurans]
MQRLPALCLALTAPLAAAQEAAHDYTGFASDDCALIENGVQRLACYDAIIDPEKARERASEERIERANKVTENLKLGTGRTTDMGRDSDQDAATQQGDTANSLVDRYFATEQALFSFSGSFVTHRPTYILPYTYMHHPNQHPYSPTNGRMSYDKPLNYDEAKYQISFKVPLLTGMFDKRLTLWFGYTQLSFWQVYNNDASKPFRETDYEPELFARYATQWDIGPGRLEAVTLGLNHQSNGQSEPQSRSWNRIMGSAAYTWDRWLFLVQPWYRIPESKSEDDNPDIDKYLGYGDYWAVYKIDNDRTLSLKLRNNFRTGDNKTSFQLGYSFPVGETIKGYVQYYNGYGESLIDYNERIQRIGIGIMLNDWL